MSLDRLFHVLSGGEINAIRGELYRDFRIVEPPGPGGTLLPWVVWTIRELQKIRKRSEFPTPPNCVEVRVLLQNIGNREMAEAFLRHAIADALDRGRARLDTAIATGGT